MARCIGFLLKNQQGASHNYLLFKQEHLQYIIYLDFFFPAQCALLFSLHTDCIEEKCINPRVMGTSYVARVNLVALELWNHSLIFKNI